MEGKVNIDNERFKVYSIGFCVPCDIKGEDDVVLLPIKDFVKLKKSNQNVLKYWKAEILAMYYHEHNLFKKYDSALDNAVEIWKNELNEEDMDFLNQLPPVDNYNQALDQIKEYSEEAYKELIEIIKNEE